VDLHLELDPVFVLSYLLRDMGVYAGIESIVLADNAPRTRLPFRAIIIQMQRNHQGMDTI
jgi:hypothetical protein